jgi:Calcium-binding EGF domain
LASSVSGNLFLQPVTFCRKVNPNSRQPLYQTVKVRRLFAFWVDWFSFDKEGSCGDVCEDVCNHKACFQDYESADETLCECFPNAKSSCGDNTRCNTRSDNCECTPGYEGNPLAGCTDVDECKFSPCGLNGQCVNSVGSYSCNCNPGYQFLNGTCVDRNECRDGTPCGPNADCTNTVGSFACACIRGYTGAPPTTFCTDINECSPTNACGPNGACSNTPGAYTCQCNNGYRSLAPNGGCVDRDECAESVTSCRNATENCLNTVGSFVCVCKVGFTGTPPSCTDVDECVSQPPVCGPDSVCNNTIGSYGCRCAPGFFGAPPACRKLGSFEKCTLPSDCQAGLSCAITSRSELTTQSCCASTDRCNVVQTCCNGAYSSGQACPSGSSFDCKTGLTCANRGVLDSTKVCCSGTFDLGSAARYCNVF